MQTFQLRICTTFFRNHLFPFSVLRRYLEVKEENFEGEFFCIHKFRHTLNKITFNGGWIWGVDKKEHILTQSSWSFQNSVTVNAFNILPFYITHESLWRPWFPHFSSFWRGKVSGVEFIFTWKKRKLLLKYEKKKFLKDFFFMFLNFKGIFLFLNFFVWKKV